MTEIRKRQVFDGSGNLISEETYEVSEDMLAREQAATTLKQMLFRGKDTWTSADLGDIAEALIHASGVLRL